MENCILCLNLINEEDKFKFSSRISLKTEGINLIKLHFVEFSENIISHTKSPQVYSCSDCWNSLKNFHDFYEKIKEKHKNSYQISEVIIKEEFHFDDSHDLFQDEPESPPPHINQEITKTQQPTKKPQIALTDESFKTVRPNFNPDDEEKIKSTADMNCELCSKPLESFSHASFHYRTQHKLKGFLMCCGKKFKRRHRILEHVNGSHLNVTYPCGICGKTFKWKRVMERHLEVHELKKDICCDHCPKTFATKMQVRYHLLCAHATPIYKCDETGCTMAYSIESQLKQHQRYVHGPGDQLICEICSKVFKKKSALDKHMTIHTRKPQDRFHCKICGHYLADIQAYKKHVKNHETEKLDNTCEHCGKKTSSRRALWAHIRVTHKLEEKFDCKFCEKKFKVELHLKEHEASHTLESLYWCEECGRGFRNQGNMAKHRRKLHPDQYVKPFYKRPAEAL